ncbi:hypothetical protein BVRB_022450 [Beta vulgaris subsp. vulgaris]|uniref:Uncharacterized protein n=1 Tax=Beta vulgaris subsp. vulgaris TaxID=3555 RepID=A0A0J8AZY9_BETVV|nr:hypothetical protein BVRB_022450 [Beta vulgaris subsp. vulgaris]
MPMAAGLDIRLMMNDNPNNGEWDKECDELDDNGSDEITDDNIQKEVRRSSFQRAIQPDLLEGVPGSGFRRNRGDIVLVPNGRYH